MAALPGRRSLGPDRGQLLLRTFRDGLAQQAGHDLAIEVTGWSGELTVNDDLAPAALGLHIDLTSLVVRDGSGGLKPLTDKDKRDIAVTARKVLGTDKHPQATITATGFDQAGDGKWLVSGTLELNGVQRPLRVRVTDAGQGRYRASASVVQSQFGIKPYSAFLGALRVRDAVEVEADVDLSEPAAGGQP